MNFYQRKSSSGIGLTPLIDVVFILLLFFMLASNFNRWEQLPIDVQAVSASTGSSSKVVHLQLHADGALSNEQGRRYVKGEWSELSAEVAASSDPLVRLTPDEGVDVQLLINTVDQLQDLGLSALFFGKR